MHSSFITDDPQSEPLFLIFCFVIIFFQICNSLSSIQIKVCNHSDRQTISINIKLVPDNSFTEERAEYLVCAPLTFSGLQQSYNLKAKGKVEL